ncbi:hypothetical protein H9647_06340 [Paenibacillus sp. Sa2BVA9]|uniref:Permease n=2 Tax=Paenibacillus gallinarum TaxID=2762232 RepID=A0ABR8SVZ4_9BACL|nr:hypothetical protein [Paenibacillus gallinarum]
MKYASRLFQGFFGKEWIFLSILLFIFSMSQRRSIVQSSQQLHQQLNQWDIVIGIFGSPFTLIYLLLPFLMIKSILLIQELWNTSYFSRLHSWRKWMLYSFKLYFTSVMGSILLFLMISFIFTLGFPWNSTWSTFSSSDYTTFNAVSVHAQESGLTPILFILLQMGLLVFFFQCMHLLLITLYMFVPKLIYMGMAIFIFIVYSMASFRYMTNPYLITLDYMSLPYSSGSMGSPITGFVLLFLLMGLLVLIVPILRSKRFSSIKAWLKGNYPIIIYGVLILFGIITTLLRMKDTIHTVWDALYLSFFGVDLDRRFSLVTYLFYIITFYGFVYFFQVYIIDYLTGRFYYMAIRYKSIFHWFSRVIIKFAFTAFVFLIMLLFVTTVLSLVFNKSLAPMMNVLEGVTLPQILYHFLINGWLQLMNGMMIVLICAWILPEGSWNVIVIGAMVLFTLPTFNIGTFLPLGLNSMGYVTADWSNTLRISALLLTYLIIEISIMLILFRKKDIAFH